MAARIDTHQLFTGKSGAAPVALTCAAATLSVNADILYALAGVSAP